MRNPHVRAPVVLVDPAELEARARGDRGFGPLARLHRERANTPVADVVRLVGGGTVDDLHAIEAGRQRATVDWVRAYAMTTTATFTFLFDVWDREGPDAADRMTVAEAVTMVRRLIQTPAGVTCPCCGGLAVERKRTLNAPVASFVGWLVRAFTSEPLDARRWVDAHPEHSRGGTYARARHWGLAMREIGQAPLWRPTEKAKAWVYGRTSIHQHVVLFRNTVQRFEGALVHYRDVGPSDEVQRGAGPAPTLPGLDGSP